MTQKTLQVLIMAGGTGGHVFPALAVADELRTRGAQINWLGTARGIEARLVPAANIPLHFISVEGVRGRGVSGLLKAPFLIVYALLQSLRIILRIKPDVVIGFGGFASGPGGLAAVLTRTPLVIHEQNAVAGTTNRLLAKIANRVVAAFPNAFIGRSEQEVKVVGNPVRQQIQQLGAASPRYQARADQHVPLRLLVLGGSLGAKAINELVPEAMSHVPVNLRPQILHQTGKNHAEATLALYMQHQVNAKVDAFIDDMAAAYAWADVVICRAGALTVSELMMAGVAAILIPLPSAIDDHQTFNAKNLTDAGAGIALVQKDLTAAKLAALLLTELADRDHLRSMAEKAQQLAKPDSARDVADICEEVARG
ncbi:undecaprenyldiphospho-muramoylpentapeptide beta-N-acetylglucosaminyltransferase [Cellvibrio mixtus]|uniref:UDP-N-acetylglucosamine--N-acetylmuramyl-(pentapeptide) pyrophosphoryl-undecaprenol N-acetylglucosamine transferase n=1 Tax=Cellvibrio mixtus TaxID=39650 RepID=A0A266Q236_9GAMM|nr:undecaprenyldiphospho-muramoylpentapeptide beta-N-acetylglucosaminyltransferase [Cellvibrio mixtus]OZY83924.1 undecaprenyldiphospho-muramoylpentapeptide beta-N-acetylglucosaminyltransferase [Cellvibrio mixtus]